MGIFKSAGKIAKNVATGGEQTPQQSTNNSASIQQSQPQGTGSASNMIQAPSVSDGGLAASTVNTGSQYGGIQSIVANRGDGSGRSVSMSKLGGLLGIEGAQSYASDYDSQSSAQSMNVNPMLNNSIGSLGQNNTGGMGLSSGLGNMFTTQKSNGLGNIGYNPQGNNYNIIGGVELV